MQRHHEGIARAAAAAMFKQYQEAIDITSELLTSGVYDEIAQADTSAARKLRAETRLLMATALHYNEAHYEDILKVLTSALDSPPEVQKDVYFTLAVVHISFERKAEARAAMMKSLQLSAELESAGISDAKMHQQQEDAVQFLQMLDGIGGGGKPN